MVEWISDKRPVNNVPLSGHPSDAYLEAVFPGVTAPRNVQIESFDRDVGRFAKRQPLEVE